jgi:hypothetical protein
MTEELFKTPPVQSMEALPLTALTPASMPRLMELAVQSGKDGIEVLERLVALNERMMDRAAREEFAQAMAKFQSECPPIKKTSTAVITTKAGGQYGYAYAELDEIARTVNPLLSSHGLSYTWNSETREGLLVCTCRLRHANGHEEQAVFSAPIDTAAAMSGSQKHAAALTYARRQSLVQVLGLTTCDPDDDGQGGQQECVTPAQVDILEALIGKRPDGSRAKLFAYLGIESMDQVPASRFEWLKSDLETKIAAQR